MTPPRRVVAITGAGGALGAAVARQLAGEPDTDLLLSDISAPSLEATVAGIPRGEGSIETTLADVSDFAEVEAAIKSAVANPLRFPRFRRKPEVRRVLTHRFPYRIFFVLRPDAVVVFRVLHGARHDREWKRATPKE